MLVETKASVLSNTTTDTVTKNKALTCLRGHTSARYTHRECKECSSIRRLQRERTPEGRYAKMRRMLRLRIRYKRVRIAELEEELNLYEQKIAHRNGTK